MPEAAILFVLLVVLPIVLIWWLIRRRHRSKFEAILHTASTGLIVLFLFFWGQYPIMGSYYLRYILGGVFLLTAFSCFRNSKQLRVVQKPGPLGVVFLGILILFSILFGTLNIFAIKAHFVNKPTLGFSFPLKGGKYYVSTGGSNAVLNLHYKASTPMQMYAIDINKLNTFGAYADGLFPSSSDEHFIYGETVYSPCSGTVVAVEGGVRDHPPFEVDMQAPLGNYVIVECEDIRVFLAHLMRGSLLVEEGDAVGEGQPIGRVGNSGFSTEPHLHLHAVKTSDDDSTAFPVGVPMRINGRFLVRNDLVRN